MKNLSAYIGLAITTALFIAIIAFEIYNNGRPETYNYCNNGDSSPCEWFYEYGNFAWENVDWNKIFGSAKIYIELFMLTPWFIYFGSKARNSNNGVNNSRWLKVIMWLSAIPIIIVFLWLKHLSQRWVIDYDNALTEIIVVIFLLSTFAYYVNLICWIIITSIRGIMRTAESKIKEKQH